MIPILLEELVIAELLNHDLLLEEDAPAGHDDRLYPLRINENEK